MKQLTRRVAQALFDDILPKHILQRQIIKIEPYFLNTEWTFVMCKDGTSWWVFDRQVGGPKILAGCRNFYLDNGWEKGHTQ